MANIVFYKTFIKISDYNPSLACSSLISNFDQLAIFFLIIKKLIFTLKINYLIEAQKVFSVKQRLLLIETSDTFFHQKREKEITGLLYLFYF